MNDVEKIARISAEQVEGASVEALSNRPNDRTGFQRGGLSAQELKAYFSALAKLSIDKVNEILDAIGDEGKESDLLKLLYTALPDDADDEKQMSLSRWIRLVQNRLHQCEEGVPEMLLRADEVLQSFENAGADAETAESDEQAQVLLFKETDDKGHERIVFKFRIPRGAMGETGERGPAGPQGEKGERGQGFAIARSFGSVEEMNAAFEDGNDGVAIGEFVLIDMGTPSEPDTEHGDIYVRLSNGFERKGNLEGAQGIIGPQGEKGERGPVGPQGEQGERGYTPQFKTENGLLYLKQDEASDWELLEDIPALSYIAKLIEAERAKVKLFITPDAEDDPAVLFGGTWERIENRFLLGIGDEYPLRDADGNLILEGGSADAVVVEHDHEIQATYSTTGTASAESTSVQGVNNYLSSYSRTLKMGESGTGKNMPPYFAVYMWQRVPDEVEDDSESVVKTHLFQNQTFNEGDQIDDWDPVEDGVRYYASITGVGGTITVSAVMDSSYTAFYDDSGYELLVYEGGMGWMAGYDAYDLLSDYIDGDDMLGYMPVTVSVWTEGGNTDNPNDGRVYLFEKEKITDEWRTDLPELTPGVTYYTKYDGETISATADEDGCATWLMSNGDQVVECGYDPEGNYWVDCLYGSATISVWYYP